MPAHRTDAAATESLDRLQEAFSNGFTAAPHEKWVIRCKLTLESGVPFHGPVAQMDRAAVS